jgi:hypothetical protein
MESLTLNQLIERLHQLHLEQETILQALEDIAQQDIIVEQEPRANIVPNVVPVAANNAPTVVHRSERDTTPSTPVAQAVSVPVPVPASVVFHIGQRVYITNRINHVLVRRATEADRTAIVTHFTAPRVAIRTINGYHTHRHPKNLRPL